ncbi:PilT protein domain protein [Candidatus Accumulibacter aalborgensis]|uniref:PilT protein domain protein n=1 Tax=Candidatus Accumulibacter aalborgensis TaxID=1860102 RepID=A0A1A8XPQ1_9PROT|nr:PIN domain-containing protein [Candidatus Accumulibacter aalborgensis]SBT05913.1 PilT protein domain protein [Candidatus Accumulibacter aalborgensis]
MIAVDTNVLVRLLTRDDDDQAQRAQGLFDAASDTDGAIFISDVVLAELCWSLDGPSRSP